MISVTKDNVGKREQEAPTIAGCKNKLIGTQVVVELSEGEQYTGILNDVTDEFVITLSYAQKMPTSEESEFILCEGTTEKVLQLRDVVRLSGCIDEKDQFNAFRTDGEISEMNGESKVKEPEFLPWNADGELPDDDEMLPEAEEKGMRRPCKNVWEDGWKAETMFEMNKDKVVGKSTFDESLSQYSNVEVQNCTEEQIKRAEQIAKAIESNTESKRNALLENDDEERDLGKATDFKLENHRPAERLQQPPQQQRQQRVVREGTASRRVSGSTSMTSGKRWIDKGQPSGERNAEQSTANWRSPNPQTSQHHQRGHFNNKPHRSSSGYSQHQQSRPYQNQYNNNQTPYKNTGSRASNYEANASQNMKNKSDVTNEPRVTTPSGPIAKPFAESVVAANSGCPSQQVQLHREEQQTPQQIPPDPEIMGKEVKSEKRSEGTENNQKEETALIIEEKIKVKEGSENGEQQKEKFKMNPAAAPFIPKSKDLNTSSAVVTANTSPLMSNPIPPFIQLPASIPTQGISTQNIVFYHQQPQTVVSAQIPSNAASYHQQTQNVLPAQIPSSVAYHQQQQNVVPAQIPPNQIFYQQQPQNVVSAQLPSNPLYATYPVANPGQSIVFVSPTAPNQAVILQPGLAQHFIPVSAAAFPAQNINQHYRTVTPNGINPQTQLQHHQTNICPPQLHPTAQGMIIQSPPPPLLNLTMPNGVVSAPPPSFHPTGRFQQQF